MSQFPEEKHPVSATPDSAAPVSPVAGSAAARDSAPGVPRPTGFDANGEPDFAGVNLGAFARDEDGEAPDTPEEPEGSCEDERETAPAVAESLGGVEAAGAEDSATAGTEAGSGDAGSAADASSSGAVNGDADGIDSSGDIGFEAAAAIPPSVFAPAGAASADAEKAADEDGEGGSMSLMDHLGELRTRLVRALIGASVGFLLCYGVAEDLFRYLSLPLIKVMPPDTKFIYTSVPEGFFVYLKVAFVAGVFLASPYIFYQVWSFIAPGLYKEERRHVLPLAIASAVFFLVGALFCYFGVFPFAFTFFMSYSTGMITAMPSLNEYLGFALKMLIAFGLVFEMPLFAYFLARLGVVTAGMMRRTRRYAILAVFIVAAILTPPDVFSQLLMAGPMLLLYELSIWIAAAVGRKEPAANAGAKPAAAAEAQSGPVPAPENSTPEAPAPEQAVPDTPGVSKA